VLAKRAATLVEYEAAVCGQSAPSSVLFSAVNVAIARSLAHRAFTRVLLAMF